ncbi:hypothetical protein ABPG72_015689 [Tetrahymena utriculariae]
MNKDQSGLQFAYPENTNMFIKDFSQKLLINYKQIESYVNDYRQQLPESYYDCSDLQVNHGEDMMERYVELEIPDNEELKEHLKACGDEASKKNIILNSQSPYKLIQDAKENIKDMKKESINLSVLVDKMKVPIFTQDISQQISVLESFKVLEKKEVKIKALCKNMMDRPIQKAIEEEKKKFIPIEKKLDTNHTIIKVSVYNSINGLKQNEYLVYDIQFLQDLVFKIECLSEKLFERIPSGQQSQPDSKFMKPSFLFIENTFYNNQYKIDVKNLYHEWQQEAKINSQNSGMQFEEEFEEKTLNEMFEQIKIQIGKPYVFRHQNKCDHMIVFNEIRLWNTDLPADKDLYPFNFFLPKVKRRKCDGCNLFFTEIICFNDKVSSKNPIFLCEKCFNQTHINWKKELRYNDFSYYPYIYE